MKSYGQYCPIARGAEIFAMRWTPLIVRNLLLGCTTFTEIRAGLPGISRTLLTQRLRELERVGVVERRCGPGRRVEYHLTDAGRELQEVCWALGRWGARWLDVAPEHLDAGVVLWGMCRLIDVERLPERRMIVRFDLNEGRWRRLWIVAQRPEAEVCAQDPGFDDDLVVRASTRSLAYWLMGKTSLGHAIHAGTIRVDGPPAAIRVFADWAGRDPFANAGRVPGRATA